MIFYLALATILPADHSTFWSRVKGYTSRYAPRRLYNSPELGLSNTQGFYEIELLDDSPEAKKMQELINRGEQGAKLVVRTCQPFELTEIRAHIDVSRGDPAIRYENPQHESNLTRSRPVVGG